MNKSNITLADLETILREINESPNKAYNKIVNTKEAEAKVNEYVSNYELPCPATTKDFEEATKHALRMYVIYDLINEPTAPKNKVLVDLLILFSENTSIRECRRCEYDNKLGFCPRCDTQAYSH